MPTRKNFPERRAKRKAEAEARQKRRDEQIQYAKDAGYIHLRDEPECCGGCGVEWREEWGRHCPVCER